MTGTAFPGGICAGQGHTVAKVLTRPVVHWLVDRGYKAWYVMYFPILAGCWEKNVQIRDGLMSQPSSTRRELPLWKKLADQGDASADREGSLSSGEGVWSCSGLGCHTHRGAGNQRLVIARVPDPWPSLAGIWEGPLGRLRAGREDEEEREWVGPEGLMHSQWGARSISLTSLFLLKF